MDGQHRADAPWMIPLYAGDGAKPATSTTKKEPSAFLRLLDRYFMSTPEERMYDAYNAYWH